MKLVEFFRKDIEIEKVKCSHCVLDQRTSSGESLIVCKWEGEKGKPSDCRMAYPRGIAKPCTMEDFKTCPFNI